VFDYSEILIVDFIIKVFQLLNFCYLLLEFIFDSFIEVHFVNFISFITNLKIINAFIEFQCLFIQLFIHIFVLLNFVHLERFKMFILEN